MMRWNRILKRGGVLKLLILLLTALVLSGCGSNSDRAAKHAKKLLEEKYDEEFDVLDIWGNGGGSYYTLCYPVSDRSIVFEGLFRLDDNDVMDEYDARIFAKEINKIVQPQMDELFTECLVFTSVFSSDSGITRKEDVTIENFIKSADQELLFTIGINKEKQKTNNFVKEYTEITKCMEKINKISVEPVMRMYLFPGKKYIDYVKYCSLNSKGKGELDNIIRETKEIIFIYKAGKLDISEEEYIQMRREQ